MSKMKLSIVVVFISSVFLWGVSIAAAAEDAAGDSAGGDDDRRHPESIVRGGDVVNLPEEDIALSSSDSINEQEQQQRLRRHLRSLRLADGDPTGYIVKFQECALPRNPDNNNNTVLLEVCLEYNNGFGGGNCDTYVGDFWTWAKFRDSFIYQHMLFDTCQVCKTCMIEEGTEDEGTGTGTGKVWSDELCQEPRHQRPWSPWMEFPEDFCNNLCDLDTGVPTELGIDAYCPGYSAYASYYTRIYRDFCADQRARPSHRNLVVDDDTMRFVPWEGEVEDCVLSDWWDFYILSCDLSEYPYWGDEISYPNGNAYIHCSLVDDDWSSQLCQDFYQTKIEKCPSRKEEDAAVDGHVVEDDKCVPLSSRNATTVVNEEQEEVTVVVSSSNSTKTATATSTTHAHAKTAAPFLGGLKLGLMFCFGCIIGGFVVHRMILQRQKQKSSTRDTKTNETQPSTLPSDASTSTTATTTTTPTTPGTTTSFKMEETNDESEQTHGEELSELSPA